MSINNLPVYQQLNVDAEGVENEEDGNKSDVSLDFC